MRKAYADLSAIAPAATQERGHSPIARLLWRRETDARASGPQIAPNDVRERLP